MTKLTQRMIWSLAIVGGIAVLALVVLILTWTKGNLHIVNDSDYQKIEQVKQYQEEQLDKVLNPVIAPAPKK